VQGNDGSYYGTTGYGGANSDGTVFKTTTNGALITLYDFGTVTNASGASLDGTTPSGNLVQDTDGYFYGTCGGGGTNGDGTVFKISANGKLTTLYDYGMATDASGASLDGVNPSGLIQGADGNFYGVTQGGLFFGGGGINFLYGTVFKISTNGVLTTLYTFAGGNNGATPKGLMQGADGNLYGTTSGFTVYDNLTGAVFYPGAIVFKITTNGVLTTLYNFGTITNAAGVQLDGASPQAELVRRSDGLLYGTTAYGGTNNDGTVFKITTNGTLMTLYSFAGGMDGANPAAALMLGKDGNFYGTASAGGSYNHGTLFQITTNGALTSLYSFTARIDGADPSAALVQGSDGTFYGTASDGGQDGEGSVFRLNSDPEFQARS